MFPAFNRFSNLGSTLSQPQNVTISNRVRPLVENLTFTSFEIQGATDTYFQAINDAGDAVGIYIDVAGTSHGFLRRQNGSITLLDFPGAADTIPLDINNLGVIVGYQQDVNGQYHGFQRSVFGSYTAVDFPGAVDTIVFGANNLGTLTGRYDLGDQSTFIGFLLREGRFTSFEDPEAAPMQTQASGINDFGLVSGLYTDIAGTTHGFLRSPLDGSFRTVDFPVVPGSTLLYRLNNTGTAAGGHSQGGLQGILTNGMNFLSVDYPAPQPTATSVRGINNRGQICGYYLFAADGLLHGFIATSQIPLAAILAADD